LRYGPKASPPAGGTPGCGAFAAGAAAAVGAPAGGGLSFGAGLSAGGLPPYGVPAHAAAIDVVMSALIRRRQLFDGDAMCPEAP
jgi:hypothetical protein